MADTKAPAAAAAPKETRAQTFVRLANARVGKALGAIYVIGNLSSANYEYTEEHVEKIVAALQSEIDLVKTKFSKPETAAKVGFSL
jgi:predicted metalloendopeptidase